MQNSLGANLLRAGSLIILVALALLNPVLASGQVTAVTANAFLNTLGVNTHIAQGFGWATYTNSLTYTGIRNIRDGLNSGNVTPYVSLHAATGVRVDLLTGASSSSMSWQINGGGTLASNRVLLALEGPNEPNNFTITYNGVSGGGSLSWVPVAQYQRDLFSNVVNSAILSNYPVFNVSEGGAEIDDVGLQFNAIPIGSGIAMPDGTQYANYANPHNYVSGNCKDWVDNAAWWAEEPTFTTNCLDGLYGEYGVTWKEGYTGYVTNQLETLPRDTTETGWPTAVVDGALTQDQQGKLYINLYMDAYIRGWSYTFIYEMYDNQGGTYYGGFYDTSKVAKLSAIYLHNFTTILADTNTFTPGSMNFTIPSQPATVHSLLLQKSNGTLYLVVWDERTNATDNVTVNLGANCPTVNVYDPTVGTNVTQVLSNVNSVALSLSDHALILGIAGYDSVGDGITDWWRAQYFGSTGATTNSQSCATCDPDGDGQNNLAEFLAGTNPTNSASVFHITSVTPQGTNMVVTWQTAGGHTNVVQAATGLGAGSYATNFTDISPYIIIAGSGDTATNYVDWSGATNSPSRYYRVRLQP